MTEICFVERIQAYMNLVFNISSKNKLLSAGVLERISKINLN